MSFSNVPKHSLSKTTFMFGMQCHRRLWLQKHLRSARDIADASQVNILQHGTDVGLLAQQLFPGGIDASPENPWSYHESVIKTRRLINSGCDIIYEAAFQFNGIMCAIDILVKKNEKWYAFEVKATNSVKPAHISDASLQYSVITNSGLPLENISVIHLNRDYTRGDTLDIRGLFTSSSILKEVLEKQATILEKSKELLAVLALKSPPLITMSGHCNIPYPCDFQGFCSQGITKREFPPGEIKMDKAAILRLKNTIEYPLYFVDFNSWMSAIPMYKGHWPYRSIPFYFSVHEQASANAAPVHSHYLADGTHTEPEILYQKLFSILKEKGSILMYNRSFHFFKSEACKTNDLELLNQWEAIQARVIDISAPFISENNPALYSLDYLLKMLAPQVDGVIKKPELIFNSRNAAALFFNLKDEMDIEKIITIRSGILQFGESSSLGIMQLWEKMIGSL